MQPISKIDQRIRGAASGVGAALLGLPFAGCGAYFVLVGIGVVDPGRGVRAPLWVIAAMGVAFAAAGLYLVGTGLRGYLRRLAADRISREQPDRPWLFEYPWAPGGVRDAPYGRAGAAWGFAVFLLVFLAPFNWWAFLSGAGSWLVVAVVTLFDLVAVALVATALHHLLGALKYGRSQLAFARFPFFPGETVEVELSPDRGFALDATLRFVEERFVTVERSGKRHSSYEAHALWSTGGRFEPERGAGVVPLRFALPEDDGLVNAMRGAPSVRYWEIVVEADRPGVDFRTTFPLPVYAPRDGGREREPVEPLPALRPRPVRPLERQLAIAALAAVGLLAVLFPGRVADLGRSLWRAVEAPLVVDVVFDDDPSIVDLALDADGSLLALSQAAVYRLPVDDPGAAERVASVPEAHQWMTWQSLLDAGRGALWIGGWDGEVMRFDDQRLGIVASRDDGIDRAVEAMVAFRGDLYAGANGVWRLAGGQGPASRVEAIPARLTEAFVADGERALYAGVAQALWRLEAGAWSRLWVIPREHGTISTLALAGDAILAGTYRGLFVLDAAGTVRHRALPGLDVRRIVLDGDRIWVVTGEHGLLAGEVPGDGEWRGIDGATGLPHEDLRDVAVDRAGRLWLAFLGGGIAVADVGELLALMGPR